MLSSTTVQYEDRFRKWTVRKISLSQDTITLYSTLAEAIWDAQNFLRKEKERHDRMSGGNNETPKI